MPTCSGHGEQGFNFHCGMGCSGIAPPDPCHFMYSVISHLILNWASCSDHSNPKVLDVYFAGLLLCSYYGVLVFHLKMSMFEVFLMYLFFFFF